jgi:DNA mismatch endonuclease, patch repair protein
VKKVALGGGRVVSYPTPTSAAASAVGKGNRRSDTSPEIALRSAIHRAGLRFRKDYLIRTPGGRARADVVFPRQRIAVFVDGCFWHCCPTHGSRPRSNAEYWDAKLSTNVARDRRVDKALRSNGWDVMRIWEHEEAGIAATRVVSRVRSAASKLTDRTSAGAVLRGELPEV